jgi:hypothetical protein
MSINSAAVIVPFSWKKHSRQETTKQEMADEHLALRPAHNDSRERLT